MDDEKRKPRSEAIKKAILNTHPNLIDFIPYLDVLNKESGRGKVLISTGFLEQLLKNVLLAFMRDLPKVPLEMLDGGNGPIGSFSSRIKLCHLLGLITDRECQELNLMRGIRNDFAHQVETSFETSSVVSRCQQLTFRVPDEFNIGDTKVVPNAEAQFTTAATSLIMQLINRAHYVAKERRTEKTWPY